MKNASSMLERLILAPSPLITSYFKHFSPHPLREFMQKILGQLLVTFRYISYIHSNRILFYIAISLRDGSKK